MFSLAERGLPIGRAIGREGVVSCALVCACIARELLTFLSFSLFCPDNRQQPLRARVLRRMAAFSLVQEAALAPHNVWLQASMELDTDQGRRQRRRMARFRFEAQDPALTDSRPRSHGRPKASPDVLFSVV